MQTDKPGLTGLPAPLVTFIVIACAIYQLFPLDFIPDPIPVAGQLDDLVAFIVAVSSAKRSQRG